MQSQHLVELTALIVAGHVRDARMKPDEIPGFIRTIHATLSDLDPQGVRDRDAVHVPAEALPDPDEIPPESEDRESGYVRQGAPTVLDDHIVCLEDGKRVVLLTRHLRHIGMTPHEYRAKWLLPDDYPMVSPRYSREKRDLALSSGFGKSVGVKRGRRKGTLHASYDTVRS